MFAKISTQQLIFFWSSSFIFGILKILSYFKVFKDSVQIPNDTGRYLDDEKLFKMILKTFW